MKNRRNILAALCILGVPSVALANTATPLMLATWFHLLLGNLIIGLIEGLLLAKVFRLRRIRCVLLLILANYVSAWLGILLLQVWKHSAGAMSSGLHDLWPYLFLMVAVAYAFTLFIEFPFVAMAFRGKAGRFRKAVRASLLIQTVSYVLLFGFYWAASGTSLLIGTEVVDRASMALPAGVQVYFISADDGDVYTGSLAKADWRRVFDLNSESTYDRLVVRRSSESSETADLAAQLSGYDFSGPVVTVMKDFAGAAALPEEKAHHRVSVSWALRGFGIPKLGDARSSSWTFSRDFRPSGGIRGRREDPYKRLVLYLETPFVGWNVRNATQIPGDKVLFEFGKNQICVLDAEKGQIALVARGRGPVAIMKSGSAGDARTVEGQPTTQPSP